jgi:hypothetical protein
MQINGFGGDDRESNFQIAVEKAPSLRHSAHGLINSMNRDPLWEAVMTA